MANSSLYRPFVIEFNDSYIVRPHEGDPGHDDMIYAKLGDRGKAAVFRLMDGRLSTEKEGSDKLRFLEPWIMGTFSFRYPIPRPERLYWVKNPDIVQQCQYIGSEDSPTIDFKGYLMGMIDAEDVVCAVPPGTSASGQMKIHYCEEEEL